MLILAQKIKCENSLSKPENSENYSMTDQPRDNRYQVSADRQSPVRKVRYVETNRGDADECTLCQLDDGSVGGEHAMSDAANDALPNEEDLLVQQQLVDAIENQLVANEPACVQAVLNKLTLVGVEREEAIDMMAYVLAVEIQHTFVENRAFDADHYERMLRALPDLPDMPHAD